MGRETVFVSHGHYRARCETAVFWITAIKRHYRKLSDVRHLTPQFEASGMQNKRGGHARNGSGCNPKRIPYAARTAEPIGLSCDKIIKFVESWRFSL